MDAALRRQKLAQIRVDFAHDCTTYPGLACIVVHIQDGEVDWSSRFQSPHETVRFSLDPPSTRHHHFSQFQDSLWQAVTPRDFGLWNEVFHSRRDSTQSVYEHFCRRSRTIGSWLRELELPLFRQFPAHSSDANYWLWAIVAFGNSLMEKADDPRRIAPEYWLNPVNVDDPGFPMPLPCKPEDIEECRQVLPPFLSHLSGCFPTKPPKSFFCQIPDVFQASLDLVNWLESPSGFDEEVILLSESDIVAEYREDGKPSGKPLTTPYLAANEDWNLDSQYISKCWADRRLTKRVKVGKKYVYHFQELAALRTVKTKQDDRELPKTDLDKVRREAEAAAKARLRMDRGE